jgi:MFS family permease
MTMAKSIGKRSGRTGARDLRGVMQRKVALVGEDAHADVGRMCNVAVEQYTPLNPAQVRVLVLASLSGALEFYDFVIYVFFAVVIGKLFFPPDLPDWLRQIQTYGIFAAGYLARPLGGIVMAHFGDTRGRKRMFTLSVLLMAIPTLLIGLLPTYSSIGAAAPLLLLAMRVMQGMAIGGQVPGGWVFVAEHAARGRVGYAIGLLTSGLTGGILLGSLVAAGVNLLFSQAQIISVLWRLPFLGGAMFGFIAMALRSWLQETPVFEAMRKRAALSRELPLRVVLRSHGRATLTSMASTWMLTAAILVVILMTPALLQELFALPAGATQLANLAGAAALVLSTVLVGAATDRFGIRTVASLALPLLVIGTYALYLGAARGQSALLPLYILAGFGAGAVSLTPVVMIRAFPAAVRFSGLSFSYNLAYAVFGGTTPLFVSWLAHLNPINPAHYLTVVTLIGFLGILLAPTAEQVDQVNGD